MSKPPPSSPAELQAYIIERMVGETGDPGRVTDTARGLVERAITTIREGLKQNLALDLGIEPTSVELSRMTDAKPDGEGFAMMVAASPASPDALVMTMDPHAVALVVTALFGGDPGIAATPISRDLSPTETVVASRVFEEIARGMGGSGNKAFEIAFPPPRAISGTEMKKHILRDGPGVRIELAVSTPAGVGKVVLSIPQRLLKANPDAQKGGVAGQFGQRFGEEVMRSGVELQATMPLARMTLGQIAGLQAGQIIEFEGDAQSQAKLSARQKTLFVCEFGKLGQNYTVRVRHPFDAGQDIMEGLVARR